MLRKPTWPTSVARPPVERKTGVDFDTEWARRYSVRLARALVLDGPGRAAVRVMASPRIDGLDRLEGVRGPVVFASNHASHVDTPLLLTSLPERFRHRTVVAAGADYFFDKRWKGALWAFTINAVPIERVRVSTRSIRLTQRLLAEGWSVVIFPEGGRTPDGWARAHQPGAAYLAAKAGAPVVPVHITGTRRILPRGGKGLRPAHTRVTFGRPMAVHEGEDARGFAARIEAEITALADEQATDWWTARRRAAAGASPALTGPSAGAWRRAWALPPTKSRARAGRAWPNP